MNTTVNPSRPPFGTRPTMAIQAMRVKSLPPQSQHELDRLRALLRRRPVPGRRTGR